MNILVSSLNFSQWYTDAIKTDISAGIGFGCESSDIESRIIRTGICTISGNLEFDIISNYYSNLFSYSMKTALCFPYIISIYSNYKNTAIYIIH